MIGTSTGISSSSVATHMEKSFQLHQEFYRDAKKQEKGQFCRSKYILFWQQQGPEP